jgi:starvation-inducible DNA-binding protein
LIERLICALWRWTLISLTSLNNNFMKSKTQSLAATSDAVSSSLSTLLADSYALLAQTHLAHWNVQGPAFFQLHAAFQSQYEELFEAIDEIAERLRALDVLAPGGLKTLASISTINELSAEKMPAKDFVAHLVECHEIAAESAAAVRRAAEQAGDLETQDMAISRVQTHQKTLWMLRSFLKNL